MVVHSMQCAYCTRDPTVLECRMCRKRACGRRALVPHQCFVYCFDAVDAKEWGPPLHPHPILSSYRSPSFQQCRPLFCNFLGQRCRPLFCGSEFVLHRVYVFSGRISARVIAMVRYIVYIKGQWPCIHHGIVHIHVDVLGPECTWAQARDHTHRIEIELPDHKVWLVAVCL